MPINSEELWILRHQHNPAPHLVNRMDRAPVAATPRRQAGEGVVCDLDDERTRWNRLLPYAGPALEAEAAALLAELEGGLTWATAAADHAGVAFYSRSLELYLALRHPLQANHRAAVVRVLWDLVCLPPSAQTITQRTKWARRLSSLLRKKASLRTTSEPFLLPWRPVLALLREINNAPATSAVFLSRRHVAAHGRQLGVLLRKARAYFKPSAVREIWNEVTASIAPDSAHHSGAAVLCAILPTHHALSDFPLAEAIELWRSVRDSSSWDTHFLSLFARLAKHQCGQVDLEPILPLVFTTAMALVQLPTNAGGSGSGKKTVNQGKLSEMLASYKGPCQHLGMLLAYSLGPGKPQARALCTQLMRLATNYMHPSNQGRWSSALCELIGSLVRHFCRRLESERSGESTAPQSCWLTDEQDVQTLVQALHPLTFAGLFAASPMTAWMTRLIHRKLAALSPKAALSPVVERLMLLMEGTHSHSSTLHACVRICLSAILLELVK
eukprot:COSAG01_NODE_8845_length_2638_cov_7.758960_1_plen_499_part_00